MSVIGLLFAGAGITAAPQAKPPVDWAALTSRLDRAGLEDDVPGVKSARAACLQLVASPSPQVPVPLARYAVAYADWRMAFTPKLSAREQEDFLKEADAQLNQAIKADPQFAEARGLLSTVYGSEIAKAPELGMTLGIQAGLELDKALRMQPDNPRLVMFQGVSKLNTPAEYGGSVTGAEALLRRATQLFDREPAGKAWPNWGRAEIHAWLGQTLAKRGDAAGARAQYAKALEGAPSYAWVKYVLLPQLGKGL